MGHCYPHNSVYMGNLSFLPKLWCLSFTPELSRYTSQVTGRETSCLMAEGSTWWAGNPKREGGILLRLCFVKQAKCKASTSLVIDE